MINKFIVLSGCCMLILVAMLFLTACNNPESHGNVVTVAESTKIKIAESEIELFIVIDRESISFFTHCGEPLKQSINLDISRDCSQKISINNDGINILDANADGMPDVKTSLSDDNFYIFYNGKWELSELNEGGFFLNGEQVIFIDGCYRLVAD